MKKLMMIFLENNKKELAQNRENQHTIKENRLELERRLGKLDEACNETLFTF